MKLNLTTNCMEHTVLKEYLEENASASLADKINHGVFIEKDGKRLLNRKDLNGFMKYACEEARKLVDKDAKSACMKSDIVFGWAIHYFEEDAIIGKLYNEDGSEYTPPKPEYKPIQRVPATSISSTPPIKSNAPAQFTLFDLLNKTEEQKEEIVEDSEIVEESEHEEELNEMNVDMETFKVKKEMKHSSFKVDDCYCAMRGVSKKKVLCEILSEKKTLKKYEKYKAEKKNKKDSKEKES